ncbi:MAG TPA: prepilin-type N-terminal cleavage/methylation domain-containing protein [Nostocaceae cyanobacterium]|nr:prepilin-type N-terminal cleavage/methylation domain-containing protein [Nostocaceae cyanobacterium]
MKKQLISRQIDSGFTVIESLVVIILIAVIVAIAFPSWLAFINQQRTRAAQNRALTMLRDAQVNAQREKVNWQVCFWDDGEQVLGSVHRAGNGECQTTNAESIIEGDSKFVGMSSTFATDASGKYRMQFKFDGSVNGIPRSITFTARNTNAAKRCVFVSTILGAMRTATDSDCPN